MEQVIQVTGLCVVGALLALVVKRGSPETALLLAVGAAVVVALACLTTAVGLVSSCSAYFTGLSKGADFLPGDGVPAVPVQRGGVQLWHQ